MIPTSVQGVAWRHRIYPLEHRDGSAGDRLSALLDLEVRLERVREWPYDASSWRGFVLYLLLDLGSWVGAAAVERLLDSMF